MLLVDDHDGFRRMARLLLQSGGYAVVGEAASAAEAIASAYKLEPDLVMLDVLLPDGDGAEVAVELAALPHPPGVVLISSYPASGLGKRVEDAPVLGFIQKDALSVARLAELFG
ncbi:response regulator [Microbacterium sp. SS28]|uniref:response regulator n=1 Tax=Microbacterium sp. SS28 TaxID=2919948 RepID=UPI001FAA5FF7|nr:response regulator [Microbacterium sp. SS28]